MELIRETMQQWYIVLSQISFALSVPIKQVADGIQIPILTAFLLGFVGSLSPCQLSTNLSAIAYVSRRLDGELWSEALAYSLGKVLVYMLTGGAVIILGLRLEQAAIPLAVVTRKAIGPLMIFIGLGLVGLIRLRGTAGNNSVASWLRSRLPGTGMPGAFSLGVVFAFTFCPTLFWLFFGLMIPLALISNGGWTFPGVFAVGTALPLISFAALASSGSQISEKRKERLKRSQSLVSRISGAIFILVGINDTLTYWFI
jgi:cytochrome c-type biogenesis protein